MLKKTIWLWLILTAAIGVAQSPQNQQAPIFAANSKYTNGVAPGYAPCGSGATNCSAVNGLSLQIGVGTVNCGPGTIVEYAGGTFTLAANTTNYVYLNTASSCAPAVKTTAFTASDIPIAQIVTGASTITSIDDVRSPFVTPGGGISSLTQDVVCSGTGSVACTVKGFDNIPLCTTFSPTNGQAVVYTTASTPNPCFGPATVAGGALPNTTTQQSVVGYTGPGTTGVAQPYNAGMYVDPTTSSTNSENTLSGQYGILAAGDSICNAHGLPVGYANGGPSVTTAWVNGIANDVSAGSFYNLCVDNSISADFSTQMAAYTYPGALCGSAAQSQAACASTSVYGVPETGNPINFGQLGGTDQRSGNSTAPYLQSFFLHVAAGASYKAISDFNKYAANSSTWWTPSGFSVTQNLIAGSQNGIGNAGTGYAVGNTYTLVCTGGTGPTYTITSLLNPGTTNGVAGSSLTSLGSGCATDTYPFVTHATTTNGSGTGATLNLFISGNTTMVSTASGSTLTNAQQVNVPVSGVAYLWYLRWPSSTGTAQVSSSVSGVLTDRITSSSTLSAQDTGNTSGNNPNTALVPSIALARFTGLTPGPQIFTITTTAAGNFGVLALGFPATYHLRGTSGPNFTIGGLVPQLGNGDATPIGLFNGQSFAVEQMLKNDGLYVGFVSNQNLDYNNDFLPAQPGNISNCVSNGTVATITYSGQFVSAAYQPGWTGTLAGMTGACTVLNGAVSAPGILSAGLTASTFEFGYTGSAIASTATAGTFTPTTGTNYNGNIANTVPPYHLSSQGNAHVQANYEAAIKPIGLSAAALSVGGGNAITSPPSGQLGYGWNASLQTNPPGTGLFGNGIYSICNTISLCAGMSYVTVAGGPADLGGIAGSYTNMLFAPSTVPTSVNTSQSIGHFTDGGAATSTLTPSNMTLDVVFRAGAIYLEPASATTTTNGNSDSLNFLAYQTNGTTGTSVGFSCNVGNNGNATTSNPGFYCTPGNPTLTGDFNYNWRSHAGGGWSMDSGAPAGTSIWTLRGPAGVAVSGTLPQNNITFGGGINIPGGTPTYTAAANANAPVCATPSGVSCTNARGEVSITTTALTTAGATIGTVTFSATLNATPSVQAWQTRVSTNYGIDTNTVSTSAFTILAAVAIPSGTTIYVNYNATQ